MQIWDTCGQEIYRSLIHSFYNNSSLSILVYSIIDKNSFNNLDGWLKEIKTYTNPTQPIFLIGNKIDLENQRKVNQNDVDIFVKKYKIDYFIETSAKDGKNILNVFLQAAKVLYKKYKEYNNILENKININIEKIDKKINLKEEEKIIKNKKKCCL
jgi:Ras-related protein Rab-11A